MTLPAARIVAVLIHPIEVAFESIQMSRPEAAKLSQPGIQFLKGLRLEPVQAALCVYCRFHKTRVAENAQMLRHGGLRHMKLALDLAYRLLGQGQQTQYCAAVRLGNDLESGFHSSYIL
jgi:hypothetical protein